MPMTDADYTEVTFELPDAQADAIATAAEEHGIPEDLVATALVKRSISDVIEQVENSDRTFIEVLAGDLGYLE